MEPSVAVAGSGLAGLACAAALAGRADCVVFERLPVAGGEHWEVARVARLAQLAAARGARFALGTQVVRWDGRSLLAVGQHGGKFEAGALVVAAGHRPLTRAELGIDGPRCGGILPGTVALHLLHLGVDLGRNPVVVGGGACASAAVAALLDRRVARVTVLAPDGVYFEPAGSPLVEIHDGARPVRVDGASRISSVAVEVSSGERALHECDALVLAHGRLPYRNIDGAVFGGPGVVFAQPGTEATDDDATEAVGCAAAEEALGLINEQRDSQELTLRIGGPREGNIARR